MRLKDEFTETLEEFITDYKMQYPVKSLPTIQALPHQFRITSTTDEALISVSQKDAGICVVVHKCIGGGRLQQCPKKEIFKKQDLPPPTTEEWESYTII